MILFALLSLAAQEAPASNLLEKRFGACVMLSNSDPEAAIAEANNWRIAGGGVLARQCLGLAYAAQQRWASAATAFEQAALEAETYRDARATGLWIQAGNARLAGAEPALARNAFDAAIATGQLKDTNLGEVRLDRARASTALRDFPVARADLDLALKLVPTDPLAWLLSATLARHMRDLDRARTDIAEAARLSPDDASVGVEAGNIAILSGDPAAARTAWQGAVNNQPDSPAGKSAAAALKALEEDIAATPKQ